MKPARAAAKTGFEHPRFGRHALSSLPMAPWAGERYPTEVELLADRRCRMIELVHARRGG